jgi:uncharacterized protein
MSDGPFVGNWPRDRASVCPVPLTRIRLGGFLGERVDRHIAASIPAGFDSPLPRGFEQFLAREPFSPECLRYGPDSDLFRWLEGASYALAYASTNERVRGQVEHVVDLLLRAQESDGPIATYIKPDRRWDTDMWHDLCMCGLLIEAAVAHHRATGRDELLRAAARWADYFVAAHEEGHWYFAEVGEREHPEMELALVRLYRATGDARYLRLAEALADLYHVGPTVTELRCGAGHRHGVRVGYLLSAYVELYLETGDERFVRNVPGLFAELAGTRSYVTGGLAHRPAEIVPAQSYDLPHTGPVAETCASVAMMQLAWRLHGLTGDPALIDHLETVLYNHYLGAISLDQLGMFYFNPLSATPGAAADGDAGQSPLERTRLPRLHGCTCCWASTWRFLAQLPEYVLSVGEGALLVNLYTACDADVRVPGGPSVAVRVETRYPRDGRVALTLSPEAPATFALKLRIPGWCAGPGLAVNGDRLPSPSPGTYAEVRREWRPGDIVELELPMAAETVEARPAAVECAGRVALRRGPLVYCLEQVDVPEVPLPRVRLASGFAGAEEEWHPELLGGVVGLRVALEAAPEWDAAGSAYRRHGAGEPLGEALLVPFYARANRGAPHGWMTWLPMGG